MNDTIRRLLLMTFLSVVFFGCLEVRKEPYLIFPGDNTQMEVHWQLNSTQSCLLEWGEDTAYALGNVITTENSSDPGQHLHAYTIAGLTPGRKYHYRVTVNSLQYTGSFNAAPPEEATTLKFLAYGDTRSSPHIHNSVAGAMISAYSVDPAFQTVVLAVGDLVTDGDNEWLWDMEFFSIANPNIRELMANVPVISAMGNHERSGTLFIKYFPYPFETHRYWAFEYGPALFIMIDQYVDYHNGSEQFLWLQNELAQTDRPWIFIFLHEPGWSAGIHSNDATVQIDIQPLCETYGVDIVFGGHNHNYARAVVNGVQHVTTGGGGAPLYVPDPGFPNIVAVSESHHFCKVEIADDSLLTFTAETPEGMEIDSFTIAK